MSIINSGFSAIGRLAALGLLALAFLVGLTTVVFMSLQGSEIKVPEIVGKDYADSEHELALLGLKIKKRADRVSGEKPNTVIEQLPKPGDTVKTGQMILVVTSKGGGESDERPPSLKNSSDEDDSEKIEEMISDKPKKPKANSNTSRKKPDTARDVSGGNGDANTSSGSDSSEGNSNKKESGTGATPGDKQNKNSAATPAKPAVSGKPGTGDTKPKAPAKPR